MEPINFSEIRQDIKNYLIKHGLEIFNDTSSDSRLVAKHGILYSIIINIKLMADGRITYTMKPTAQFLEAFQLLCHSSETKEMHTESINAIVWNIRNVHKKYDELKSAENKKSCAEYKYADLLVTEKPCTHCYNKCFFHPKESNKQEAKVTNMRDVRIKKVMFNKPYTIVLWKDGSKTMIKCGENDVYDKEKGLALCIAKKTYGNKYGWYDIFQKYIPELKEHPIATPEAVIEFKHSGQPLTNAEIAEKLNMADTEIRAMTYGPENNEEVKKDVKE